MNRFFVLFFMLTGSLLAMTMFAAVVKAQSQPPMTEAHITRIRDNCVEAQSTLSQLHASDALLRVNRGQLYESISTKLMAPLNSRIALNKLDGSSLVSTTVDYETTLDKFRSDYQQYEQTLSSALQINCTKQPVTFYDDVQKARADRTQVHNDIVALETLIEKYRTEFEAFATKTAQQQAAK